MIDDRKQSINITIDIIPTVVYNRKMPREYHRCNPRFKTKWIYINLKTFCEQQSKKHLASSESEVKLMLVWIELRLEIITTFPDMNFSPERDA